jgi:mono/diheme cytochrome c family protein
MKLPLTAIVFALAIGTAVAAVAAAPSPYAAKCQMCHGATGLGDTPAGKAMGAQSFKSPEVIAETDAALFAVIKNGKGKMPPFNGKLTDAEIAASVASIRSFQK